MEVSDAAKKQIEPFFVLETLSTPELIGLICHWRCLLRCDLYEYQSAVWTALAASVELGNNELGRRGEGLV